MLLAAGSVKGSPGVTTAAVGLAAGWPAGDVPVLVECDPAGGDLVARFRLEPYPGLVSLAAAARQSSQPGLLWQHTQRLPGGLPVVVGAIGGDQAKAALSALAASGGTQVLGQAARAGRGVVVVDCGRVESGSAALPVVRAADGLLLVVRPRADELAHTAALLPAAAGWCRRVWLVLAGDGYPPREVARELGIPVLGSLPVDLRGTAVLAGEPGSRHGPARSALGRAAAALAAAIRAQHGTTSPATGTAVPGRVVGTASGTVLDGASRP
jgi:hypothetical protein